MYEIINQMLKPAEKHVIASLREANGEMAQNKLSAKLGLNKVKATRVLFALEQKGLIVKHRHGLTNLVKLKR
jgi:uncharacterized membrane protein